MMVIEVSPYVSPGFDIVGYAQSVCAQLRQGDTARQAHEELQRAGLDRNGATQFEAMAVITYCRDQEYKLPDGPNEWWG